MALSELYEIGKRSRNPLKGVSKDGLLAGERLLVTEIEDSDGGSMVKIGEENQGNTITGNKVVVAAAALPSRSSGSASSSGNGIRPRCVICRLEVSKYNCPSCNIPYCSLICYRSNQHSNCSRPFLEKSLRLELGQDGKIGMVDEEERKAMMDVLRRMKSLGQKDEILQSDEEVEEEEEEGDVTTFDLDGIDLDQASIEELLSMLSAEERARFEAAVQDEDPSQAKAQALFEKLIKEQQTASIASPWWEETIYYSKNDDPLPNKRFIREATKLADQVAKAKVVKIEYNIVAVLLAYAFIVRHCDVRSLNEILPSKVADHDKVIDDGMPPLEPIDREAKDDVAEEKESIRNVAQEKLAQFAPFLSISGDASKVVLDSIEQVTLSFAAAWVHQEATFIPSQPVAKTISFLYKDVERLIDQPRLVQVSDSSTKISKTLLALSDLNFLLSAPSQRKLLFYGAYWIRLSEGDRQALVQQIASEIARLTAEIQRAEDEERFQAANHAIEQHIVYY